MEIIKRPKGGAYLSDREPVEKTVAISCRVPVSMLKRLKTEARAKKCSMSALLFSILSHREK